jgi:hypothetical protein
LRLGVLIVAIALLLLQPLKAEAETQGLMLAQAEDSTAETGEADQVSDDEDALPPVHYVDDVLPEQVIRTRNALMRAARSGDFERVRPVLAAVAPQLIFSFGADDDPIAFWKHVSMDGTGRDILADMIKVFSSGFVQLNAGTEDEIFIWPYHFIYPLEDLTSEQEVELYLLVPAEYRQHMEDAGGYIGFRAAIRPTGEFVFFVAGD